MADITIDDLLHWERGLSFRPPAGAGQEEGLERVVSWAVTIRASPPVVPALRGGEIVVAEPRVLERVLAAREFDRAELLRTLAAQPIAALMVDPSFDEGAVPGVSLLVASGVFPHDAESNLNRLLTERRGDLYRIGSDLSRALTVATVSGAGLDALLEAAAQLAGRALVLQAADGAVLASSSGAPARGPFGPEAFAELLGGARRDARRLLDREDRRWLAQGLRPVGRPGDVRGAVLAIELQPDTATEVERLTLSQTAAAVDLLLGQAARLGASSPERSNRESLVADLLLGRLLSREAADACARLLGLDPSLPARVALFVSSQPGFSTRVRSLVPDERGRAAAALSGAEYAVVVTGAAAAEGELRDLAGVLRAARAASPDVLLAVSDVIPSASRSAAALEQAQLLARLAGNGSLAGPLLRADAVEQVGAFGLLMLLASGSEGDPRAGRRRMAAFAEALLGALEEHDRRRGSELVPTLAAYLELGGALSQAAERLGVHRNTLSYRLGRITDLSGSDLADARTRYLLQTALLIRSLERALGD